LASEKTEKATPKRREDERKKGNVFQGRDINIALSLLVMFVVMRLLGKYIYIFLLKIVSYYFNESTNAVSMSADSLKNIIFNAVICAAVLILPFLLISAFTAFVLSGIQTKFIFNIKSASFKIERLNPANGFKRLFSMRSAFSVVKSIITVIIITVVIYNNIVDFAQIVPTFYSIPVSQSVYLLSMTFYNIFIKVCGVIIVVGILDYFFQWWQHERDLKMSKQEIKEEYKQLEGDPQVKSQIKNIHQRMSRKRMMQKVPEADVIIVNPDHYAVALKYDAKKTSAPVVVAKGVDFMALKIKEIAAEHDIKIEENPPLARALYKVVEVDKEIPPEFYQAVAEILSYVYSLKRVRNNSQPKGKIK